MRGSTSIAISLDDLTFDISEEKNIIQYLKKCKGSFSKNFKVYFFNENLTENQIKNFISRNSDDLFFINSEITKSKIIYSWFVINLDKDAVNSWRYKFVGNILNGLKQYIDILNHIERKRGKHESSNYRK